MILDQYTTLPELILDINTYSPIKVKIVHHAEGRHVAVAFADKNLPISINEAEFNFMHDMIVKNNLNNGFELSTGTGISTIALSIAMKKIGGKLISVDSYFEELKQISDGIGIGTYTDEQREIAKANAYGYRLSQAMSQYYKTQECLNLVVGWSPYDCHKELLATGKMIDFVFLDCPKSDDELKRDLDLVVPLLAEKYAVFIHDAQCFTKVSFDRIKQMTGREVEFISDYYLGTSNSSKRFFPLTMIRTCDVSLPW